MDNPVIDTKDIFVDVEPLPEFDVKVQVRMPAHCIQKITTRLIEGGLEQTDEQLVQILLKVSVDEAISRLEKPPVWGPAFANTKPPSLPLESEDFIFDFIVDQIPDLQLPPFESLEIKRPRLDISEDLIDLELHSQSLELGEHQTHTGRIETDHRVTLNLEVFSRDSTVDSVHFDNLVGRMPAGNTPLVLNGMKFPDLDTVLRGHVQGDVIDDTLVLPKVLQNESSSTNPHRVNITIVKVESSSPLSLDEVVKHYGLPSLSVLKLQIKASLEHRFELDKMTFMTEDLFTQLVDSINYSPSERIVKMHLFEIGQKAFQSHQKDGASQEEAQKFAEKASSSVKDSVINKLKRQVIVARIASEHQLQFGEENIQEQIRNLAALQSKRPEDYRQELIDSGQISLIQSQVLEHQVTRLVAAKATMVDCDQE